MTYFLPELNEIVLKWVFVSLVFIFFVGVGWKATTNA